MCKNDYTESEFDTLMRHFYLAIQRVKLAAHAFDDPSELPEEYIPAAVVVAELPKELDRLYDGFGGWHVDDASPPRSER